MGSFSHREKVRMRGRKSGISYYTPLTLALSLWEREF
jgi:hypothetical protein